MGFEVELKAHVDDPIHTKTIIEGLAGISPLQCEYKDDIYYGFHGEEPVFRLRRESYGKDFSHMTGSLLFTSKQKSLKDGIEVNREHEFSVSDDQSEQAEQFCTSLGYEIYIRKTKKGYLYEYSPLEDLPPLHVELVEVLGLGWFVEMEFILEDEALIEKSKNTLLSVLDSLLIARESVEERYYMHLLKERLK
ncbi:MAG: CYTH domain-containing protein [Sphaerochaeta sp.]